MSFIDNATEILDRAEASLCSLIADALKAQAYREITTIANMAESLSTIAPGRSDEARKHSVATVSEASKQTDFGGGPAAGPKKSEQPSWVRPLS